MLQSRWINTRNNNREGAQTHTHTHRKWYFFRALLIKHLDWQHINLLRCFPDHCDYRHVTAENIIYVL